MSEKCAYARFMYKKCQREKKQCRIYKKILDDCNNGNLYLMGCSKEYKHTTRHENAARESRRTAVDNHGQDS
jgi:uncharacterized protein YgiB involved in biofilm formation